MSVVTVAVTCTAYDQQGDPVVGAVLTARLNQTEIYNGLIVPEVYKATADANGVAVLNLWPNALGVNGSMYQIKATNPDTGKKFLDVLVSVPNSACNLHQIITAEPYPAIDASAQALAAAQGAQALATAQADIATVKAGEADASAVAASGSASAAATSALAASISEGNADASEAAAAASLLDIQTNWQDKLDTAAAQATVATDQAVIATAQAVISTTQAGTSTTQAGTATTARIAAEAARDAALLSRGVFATTAKALSKGVINSSALVAGSSGTNGTFDVAFSGGAGSGAAARFTVAGGALTGITITATGDSYTSAPTMSFAASSGLTGASATAVIGNNVDVNEYFSVPSAESTESVILYQNVAGVATEVKRYLSSGLYLGGFQRGGYSWAVVDSLNKLALGIDEAGHVIAGASGDVNAALDTVATPGVQAAASALSTTDPADGYAFGIVDQDGKMAVTVFRSGVVKFGSRQGAFNDDVVALQAKVNGTEYLVSWGDSLSQGAGSTGGLTYQAQLNTLLGGNRTIVIDAAGGSDAEHILCRQGGLADSFTVAGNLIPAAATAVSVTPTIGILYASSPYTGTALGWLNGVYGTLAVNTSNAYTFTRAVAGTAVITPPGTQFVLESWTSRATGFPSSGTFDADYAINLFWVGTNSLTSPNISKMPQQLVQAVEKLKTLEKKFIIIGPITTMALGNAYRTAFDSMYDELRKRFPNNFVDAQYILTYSYDSGIPQDVIDFGNKIVPTSLRADSIHLNNTGYGIVANSVYKLLNTKGWLT